MTYLRFSVSRFGSRVLRVVSVVGLVVCVVLAWVMPADAASIALPDTSGANCDSGVLESLPGAVFADGALYLEIRCYLNNTATSWSSMSSSVLAGTAGVAMFHAIVDASGNGSAGTCSSVTGKTIEHGALVSSGGTVVAPDSGEDYPQNYVAIGLTCNFTPHGTVYRGVGPWSFAIGSATGTDQVSAPGAANIRWGVPAGCHTRANPTGSTYDNALCSRDLSDSGETSAFLDATNNPDWYGTWVGPAVSPCVDNVDFSYVINGEEIDVVETMNVTVVPDDDVELRIAFGNDSYPTLNENSIKWRRGPGEIFAALPVDGVIDMAPLPIVTAQYDVPEGVGFALEHAEIMCTDVEGEHFLSSGNTWYEEPRPNRACWAVRAVLPKGQDYDLGETIEARFSVQVEDAPYLDDDEWVSLAFFYDNGEEEGTTDLVESFSIYGAQIGGGSPFTDELPVTGPSQGLLRFEMPVAGDPSYGWITCEDSTGSTRIYGAGTPQSGTFYGSIDEESACYSGSGMTLSPGTWVKGFGRMIGCVSAELFVPDPDVIGAEWDETYEAMGDAVPFSWVVNAHGLVSDASFGMASAIEGAADECFVWIADGTAGSSVPESSRGVCPGELASGAGAASSWVTFRDLLGKAVWIFWVLALGRVVLAPPTPPEVITEENGQMAWNM